MEKQSALLEVSLEEQVPVDADHSAMSKFETDRDETFEKVYKSVGRMRKSPRHVADVQLDMSLFSAINNLDAVKPLDEVMQDADGSSSGSELSLPMYTLTQLYQGTLDDLKQCLQKVANLSLDPKLEKVYRYAKSSLGDCHSSLICWGCDIRIETDSLKHVEGTIFDLTIRSCFSRITDLLQQLRKNFADPADLDDLNTAISSLKEFVGPIRTSQALNSGQGPLDGMAKKLNDLADLSRKEGGATD